MQAVQTPNSRTSTVLVLGPAAAGKITFISALVSSHSKPGHDISAAISKVELSVWPDDEHRYTLVDAPNIDGVHFEEVTNWLKRLWTRYQSTINGVLYIQSLTDLRWGPIQRVSLERLRNLVGESYCTNVILAILHWDNQKDGAEAMEHGMRKSWNFLQATILRIEKGNVLVRLFMIDNRRFEDTDT